MRVVIDASEHSHGSGMKSYLIMMAVRLLEMRRVLKSTGSVFATWVFSPPVRTQQLRML